MAAIVRKALDRYLEVSAWGGPDRDKAIAAIGRFRSGMGNVADDHDEHLGETFSS